MGLIGLVNMESWSPFRRDGKPGKNDHGARGRGRRRQRLQQASQDQDAVLTDRDAAHAAETARQDRTRPQAPAWERYSSVPLSPSRVQRDIDDGILSLAEAACSTCHPVTPADTRRKGQLLRATGARRDYGTGPAYEPQRMH